MSLSKPIPKPTPRRRKVRTSISPELYQAVCARDQRCVGPLVGMPEPCVFMLEVDHVRASGGLGMKSPATLENLVLLCRFHHSTKTYNGRKWRPLLVEYLERVNAGEIVLGFLR